MMQDNYEAVCKAVYAMVEREGLSQHKLNEIDDVLSGKRPADERHMHFEYRNDVELDGKLVRSECTIYITLDSFGERVIDDETGNHWRRFTPRVQVSWPSWGSSTIAECDVRLDLMNRVRTIARGIEQALVNVEIWTVTSTKAERDELAKASAESTQRALIWRMCKSQTKHLKVGQTREYGELVKRPLPAGVTVSQFYDNMQVPSGSTIRIFRVSVMAPDDMPVVVTITRIA